jgi:hypothetical protein
LNSPHTRNQRLSVGVQAQDSQCHAPATAADCKKIDLFILDLSRLTLADVDGVDAIISIFQHLARLSKLHRPASESQTSESCCVYIVTGNHTPNNLFLDPLLQKHLDHGMVFRSSESAIRHWHLNEGMSNCGHSFDAEACFLAV